MLSNQGYTAREIAAKLNCNERTALKRIGRLNRHGVAGLEEVLRRGRPRVYGPEDVGAVIQAALTPPRELGLPFASWTLDRLVTYLSEERGVGMRRARVAEMLAREDLRWRKQEGRFGERVDPEFAEKRGPSSASTHPLRRQRRVICVDEMGPLSVRSYPGRELVRGWEGGLADRARWELGLDRDRKLGGYVFGAFIPAIGEALTATYTSRSIVTFVDFLEKVETWEQIEEAISRAVDYWNVHRHPYVWGRRRRHRAARRPGVGAMPTIPAMGG